MSRIAVAVIGATGYTGAELVRLLLGHPDVELVELVGHSKAGKPVESVLPALAGMVPNGEFEKVILALYPKDKKLVLGCRTGVRSLNAALSASVHQLATLPCASN